MKARGKSRKILIFIKNNEPCKAGAICKACGFTKRAMNSGGRTDSYWVGWSGYRAHLTRWGYCADKSKIAIKLTDAGYVLTDYGQSLIEGD